MVIVDMGSGETCRNDWHVIAAMIYALADVDSGKQEVVIKWQLFGSLPPLIPLSHNSYQLASQIAFDCGYKTTASAFDDASIAFLLSEGVPWIKIAARPHLYHYADDNPDVQFVVSLPTVGYANEMAAKPNVRVMYCVPEYPANPTVYETMFGGNLHVGISDHTSDFYLYHKYKPLVYEAHFKLPESKGADSGAWARTPAQWGEIL